jgi:hypothetical protein
MLTQTRSRRGDIYPDTGGIDGRPHFAKPSIADGKKVRIAAIDPDFQLRRQPLSLMECAGRFLNSLSSFSLRV